MSTSAPEPASQRTLPSKDPTKQTCRCLERAAGTSAKARSPSRPAPSRFHPSHDRVRTEAEACATEIDPRQQAFAQYVQPEIEVLHRVARTLTAQSADAEDIVQETLLRAYRSVHTFDGQHARAWLLTILRNTEHNRHRKQQPELLHNVETTAHEQRSNRTFPSPEQFLIDAALDNTVEEAFHALPKKLQIVVQLIDIEGLTHAEAAAFLTIPAGTVMSRLHRARTRIRRRLEADGVPTE
jgi:RNA polymerase sigma-70 factor (ECF subfamily)